MNAFPLHTHPKASTRRHISLKNRSHEHPADAKDHALSPRCRGPNRRQKRPGKRRRAANGLLTDCPGRGITRPNPTDGRFAKAAGQPHYWALEHTSRYWPNTSGCDLNPPAAPAACGFDPRPGHLRGGRRSAWQRGRHRPASGPRRSDRPRRRMRDRHRWPYPGG